MGPALACIGGSSFANMSYITFLDNRVTSFEFGPDIYSDGSCTDPFWYSLSRCPLEYSCHSCNVSSTHVLIVLYSYIHQGTVCSLHQQDCFCYCDSLCQEISHNSAETSEPLTYSTLYTTNTTQHYHSTEPHSNRTTTNSTPMATIWIMGISLLAVACITIAIATIIGIIIILRAQATSSNTNSPVSVELVAMDSDDEVYGDE